MPAPAAAAPEAPPAAPRETAASSETTLGVATPPPPSTSAPAAQPSRIAAPVAAAPIAAAAALSPAPAEEMTDVSGVAFDLLVGTHFPVSIGADAQLELPLRILLRLHFGWMPPAYIDAINGVATGFNWYNTATANLVSAAVDHAFVFRSGLGFRPFPGEGFELSAGYTMVMGGGSLTSAEVIEAASGAPLLLSSTAELPMSTTLHAFHAEVNWRWVIEEHWVIVVGVGYVHTLAADTRIEAPASSIARVSDAFTQAEVYLDDILTTYGIAPVVKLRTGFRF